MYARRSRIYAPVPLHIFRKWNKIPHSLFFFLCVSFLRWLLCVPLNLFTHEKWRAQTNVTQSLMRMRMNKLVASALTLNLLPLKIHDADWCEKIFILFNVHYCLILWRTALHFDVINSFWVKQCEMNDCGRGNQSIEKRERENTCRQHWMAIERKHLEFMRLSWCRKCKWIH